MDTARTVNDGEKKWRIGQEFIREHPPRIRFAADIHEATDCDGKTLDNFEFMTAMMEAHPIFPFEHCSFGSDLLDARRALAYHIIIRQLGHARSLIANVNIRNRVGIGVSLRCMLEMNAFAEFFCQRENLNDSQLIELFLLGQAFLGGNWAAGSWHELEEVWREQHGEPLPEDAKNFFRKMLGLPNGREFLKPMTAKDEGFAYLYSRYSEFVHPAFARSRDDLEEAIESREPHRFGSSQYYEYEVSNGAPIQLMLRDVDAGCFCLEAFWHAALEIDPHSDKELRPQVVELLTKVYGRS
jgi:hypothetical protein